MPVMDLINASFEFAAGGFVLLNVLETYRRKQVVGVHWAMVTFFTVWGVWNLAYYPSLDQAWSFVGSLFVFTANGIWLFQIFYYRRQIQ